MPRPLRPYRDGAFRILALAVGLAALALASVILFRAELDARVTERSAETLGGALVLEGTRAPEPAQARAPDPVRRAQTWEFPSVVMAGDESLLVGVKAVGDDYPLVGELTVAPERFGDERPRRRGPEPGTVWVADNVIDRLPVTVGDTLAVGRAELEIAGVVRREPDQGAAFYSVNPRVLMHAEDLEAAGVIGPGSRLTHSTLFDGPEAAIASLRANLEESLRPDQSLQTVTDASMRALEPLRQLALYVTLGVLLVVLLCGVAVYLATVRRATRRARLAALLRSFGARRRQVVARLLGGEILALLPMVALGGAAGAALILAAREALGWEGPLAAGPGDWAAIAVGPLALWLVFGLPQILALARQPVVRLLHGDIRHVRAGNQIVFAASLGLLVAAAAWLTGSLAETGWLLTLLVALVVTSCSTSSSATWPRWTSGWPSTTPRPSPATRWCGRGWSR